MTALQSIIKEAKIIKKKYPNKEWKSCIKQASAIYASKHKGKSPVGKKKTVKKSIKGVKESNKLKRSIKKSGYTLPHGYQTKKAVRMSGINTQIGAIKKGSKFIYYCGIRIEKKPIEVLVGNKKKKQYVYIVNTGVYHTLQSAKAWIRYLAK